MFFDGRSVTFLVFLSLHQCLLPLLFHARKVIFFVPEAHGPRSQHDANCDEQYSLQSDEESVHEGEDSHHL